MKNELRVSLIAICLSLLHCTMASDVAATKNTSQDIEGYSKDLDQNSQELKADSTDIARGTRDIYDGGRKDLSFQRPNERFNDLLNAKGDTEKVRYATALALSFEFQQWTGAGQDTVKKEQQLYAKAMRDFFSMFDSLINHDYGIDTKFLILFPSQPDERWKQLASMAVAMSEIDPDQQAAAELNHIQPQSIYSLIVSGLSMKADANNGKAIPDYAKQVLDWEDDAVFFLQLRQNYYPAMVLARLTDFVQQSTAKQAQAFLVSWTANLPNNATQIQDQGVSWLMAAQETQRTIVKLGYSLKFNSGIMQTFSNANFAVPGALQTTSQLQVSVDALNQRASELQDTFKTGNPH